MRLDPELLCYLAELAARKQRRTLSSFIEWAIQQNLKNTYLELVEGSDEILSIASEASDLWDVDEPDRFVKLAIRYPQMLTNSRTGALEARSRKWISLEGALRRENEGVDLASALRHFHF